MSLIIAQEILNAIRQHGEAAYPEEGAGLILGKVNGSAKIVLYILPLANAREQSARHNRYMLSPQDYLQCELQAAQLGLEVLGVFHSHPDHPNQPSEFDREWAMPSFSYIITNVQQGIAVESRSWVLSEDRSAFLEESLDIQEGRND